MFDLALIELISIKNLKICGTIFRNEPMCKSQCQSRSRPEISSLGLSLDFWDFQVSVSVSSLDQTRIWSQSQSQSLKSWSRRLLMRKSLSQMQYMRKTKKVRQKSHVFLCSMMKGGKCTCPTNQSIATIKAEVVGHLQREVGMNIKLDSNWI